MEKKIFVKSVDGLGKVELNERTLHAITKIAQGITVATERTTRVEKRMVDIYFTRIGTSDMFFNISIECLYSRWSYCKGETIENISSDEIFEIFGPSSKVEKNGIKVNTKSVFFSNFVNFLVDVTNTINKLDEKTAKEITSFLEWRNTFDRCKSAYSHYYSVHP